VVERIEGITQVENKIEVLPLSSFDDRIRLGVLRAVYGNSVLDRYAMRAQPPIRIVVKNGDVTLEGVVAREMEKNVAFIRANGVPGVFSVTNNLRVEPKS
jgi:hyperosmotically inducible protein